MEKTLSLETINRAYSEARERFAREDFFSVCLDALDVGYSVSDDDLARIPTEGPLVVVTNHPFGAIEGIMLCHLLLRVRPDVKALGNYLLQRVEEIRERVIPVDPFGTAGAARANLRGLRQCLDWLRGGHVLATFPAGEVSHLHLRRRRVVDTRWTPHVASLVRRTGSAALPVYFPGRNSALFQALGLIHPRLRTAMLPHELVNKRRKQFEIRVGHPVLPRTVEESGTDDELTELLRTRTYFLANRPSPTRPHQGFRASLPVVRRRHRHEAPLAPPVDAALLRQEVESLPAEQRLSSSGSLSAHIATAPQIPNLLPELGRLRELTFRQVGEGTGRPRDLDRYDLDYKHLFLWNDDTGELAGAYRLGLVDELVAAKGRRGLYTSSLFRYKPGFLAKLPGAIELGRSFIRPEYQRKAACLSLLWRGIGELITRDPRYSVLLGPVSISRDYHTISRNLVVQFLREKRLDHDLASLVRPRKPYRGRAARLREPVSQLAPDVEELSLLVSELEEDGKGIPVLLRQYLKLNASILSFNVDPSFSDVIDCLILVDLRRTDERLLKRFMGAEGLARFRATHGARAA